MAGDAPLGTVWIAGHKGMLGSALVRRLQNGTSKIIHAERSDLDLTRQSDVEAYVEANRPDAIVIAAAKVGGLGASKDAPADFITENVLIASNVIRSAHQYGVRKLIYVASSAAYPANAQQPLAEDALLTGAPDPFHEAYSVAKLAGIYMVKAMRDQYSCEYFSVLPCNLYGPGANFDPKTSHVIPALIRRIHEAKMAGDRSVDVWGTGTPRREFLFNDDCADAIAFLLHKDPGTFAVNAGSGADHSISEVVKIICEEVGFSGEVIYNKDKPDGVPRRLMDDRRLREAGWQSRTTLKQGIGTTYQWFLQQEYCLSS